MNTPLLGPPVGPSPFMSIQPQRRSPLLRFFVFTWLLAVFILALIHFTGGRRQPVEAAQRAQSTPTARVEGAVRRLDVAVEKAATAGANLRRAEDQITRALPVVERNGLLVEKRRLADALVAAETARRTMEQFRQDAESIRHEFTHSILKEDNDK